MESIRKISTSIKEASKKHTEQKPKRYSCYFFVLVASIAILNFSIPLFTSCFTSCSSLFVNAVGIIESTFFININDGEILSPENFVKNNVRYTDNRN